MNYSRSITPSGVRPNPFAQFSSLPSLSQIDEVFERLRAQATPSVHQIPVDLFESDESYIARFELPGVKRERIDLVAEGSVLTLEVRAEAAASVDIEASDDLVDEAEPATPEREPEVISTRALKLPEDADSSAVSAKLEDGLLILTIPKSEDSKPRSINIA